MMTIQQMAGAGIFAVMGMGLFGVVCWLRGFRFVVIVLALTVVVLALVFLAAALLAGYFG